ncbi:MAG: Rne/Rng family ribonuclease [bacterium]|nr:Rne/Rng family ribonuclease [bacterium]
MSRELLVSRVGGQTWAALRESGVSVELYVEPSAEGPHAGRILKARVAKILPGMQSAFLDIGEERGGFLHNDDLWLPGDPPRVGRSADGQRTRVAPPIQDRLKVGRDLLVQVSRESMRQKGARVTCFITLADRLLVLAPHAAQRSVSRRIREADERERLEEILGRLPGPEVGFVARTAAHGAQEEPLRAAAEALLAEWRRVSAAAEGAPVPSVVHGESDLLTRLLRDLPADGADRIVVDSEELRQQALTYLEGADTRLVAHVSLHAGDEPLLEAEGLSRELSRVLRPRVWLKSGGHVVFEETEALVSIDVNTGKFLGKRNLEETALKTNLEAAGEITRQLRLRDLGGIIVIDFIDMESQENRQQVIETLEIALRPDRARTRVVGLSDLGLLQLTRQRRRPSLAAAMTRRCPGCSGQGRVRNARTVATDVLLELKRRAAADRRREVVVRAGEDVLAAIREGLDETLGPVRLVEDSTLPPDRYESE